MLTRILRMAMSLGSLLASSTIRANDQTIKEMKDRGRIAPPNAGYWPRWHGAMASGRWSPHSTKPWDPGTLQRKRRQLARRKGR